MHAYVPVIPLSGAQPCLMNRDARHKAGHDGGKTHAFFVMAGLVPAIHVFTLCAVDDE